MALSKTNTYVLYLTVQFTVNKHLLINGINVNCAAVFMKDT